MVKTWKLLGTAAAVALSFAGAASADQKDIKTNVVVSQASNLDANVDASISPQINADIAVTLSGTDINSAQTQNVNSTSSATLSVSGQSEEAAATTEQTAAAPAVAAATTTSSRRERLRDAITAVREGRRNRGK